MLKLVRLIDKVTGYIFIPSSSGGSTTIPNTDALFSSAMGALPPDLGSIADVQERWVDHRQDWDEWEREEWKKEGEERRRLNVEQEKHRVQEKVTEMNEEITEDVDGDAVPVMTGRSGEPRSFKV